MQAEELRRRNFVHVENTCSTNINNYFDMSTSLEPAKNQIMFY